MLRKTPAKFVWGSADKLFPDNANRHSYYTLVEAYGDSGMLQCEEVKGQGHKTTT